MASYEEDQLLCRFWRLKFYREVRGPIRDWYELRWESGEWEYVLLRFSINRK